MKYTMANFLREDALWGMAIVGPDVTGLPCNMFLFCQTNSHSAYIVVGKDRKALREPEELMALSVSPRPKIICGDAQFKEDIIQAICAWIVTNRTVLMDYWECRLDTSQMLRALQYGSCHE